MDLSHAAELHSVKLISHKNYDKIRNFVVRYGVRAIATLNR